MKDGQCKQVLKGKITLQSCDSAAPQQSTQNTERGFHRTEYFYKAFVSSR